MNEADIISRFESDKVIFEKWGNYLIETLKNEFDKNHILLRVPAQYRVKDVNSLIEKALYRKNYSNPYEDVTDKVGIRFIVLLEDDVIKISNIIKIKANDSAWNCSLDRDFEKEREESPTYFDYQALHYVIKNQEQIVLDEINIPCGTPCEVQIKTMLQHAYSELTHDLLYKRNVDYSKNVYRYVARSMALIETTDNIFCTVNEHITNHLKNENKLIDELKNLLPDLIPANYNKKLNSTIYEALREILVKCDIEHISEFLTENKFILNSIKKNYDVSILFSQPIVLVLYYLVHSNPYQLNQLWPYTREELDPIYTDLGVSHTN